MSLRGISRWCSLQRRNTQKEPAARTGWPEARPIVTSDPLLALDLGQGEQKIGEVVNFSATIHRTPPLVAAPVHRLHLWTKLAELLSKSLQRSCKRRLHLWVEPGVSHLQGPGVVRCTLPRSGTRGFTSTTDSISGPRWLRSRNLKRDGR